MGLILALLLTFSVIGDDGDLSPPIASDTVQVVGLPDGRTGFFISRDVAVDYHDLAIRVVPTLRSTVVAYRSAADIDAEIMRSFELRTANDIERITNLGSIIRTRDGTIVELEQLYETTKAAYRLEKQRRQMLIGAVGIVGAVFAARRL